MPTIVQDAGGVHWPSPRPNAGHSSENLTRALLCFGPHQPRIPEQLAHQASRARCPRGILASGSALQRIAIIGLAEPVELERWSGIADGCRTCSTLNLSRGSRRTMGRSIARDTLEKARYFLDRAVAAEADPQSPRTAYTANLARSMHD